MGELKLGTVKGLSIYFKFNSSPSDEGASDNWETGMKYIGIASGLKKPPTGYVWAKFIGEDGAKGEDGRDGRDGVDGTNGKDGADGKNGADGKDAVVVAATASTPGIVKLGSAGGAATYEHSHGSFTLLTASLSGTTLTLSSENKTV